MNRSELLKIRNFGEKSYVELFDRMRASNLLPPDLDPALKEEESAGAEG
jgi:DNA-directed RNA polymerase alpha subunit